MRGQPAGGPRESGFRLVHRQGRGRPVRGGATGRGGGNGAPTPAARGIRASAAGYFAARRRDNPGCCGEGSARHGPAAHTRGSPDRHRASRAGGARRHLADGSFRHARQGCRTTPAGCLGGRWRVDGGHGRDDFEPSRRGVGVTAGRRTVLGPDTVRRRRVGGGSSRRGVAAHVGHLAFIGRQAGGVGPHLGVAGR